MSTKKQQHTHTHTHTHKIHLSFFFPLFKFFQPDLIGMDFWDFRLWLLSCIRVSAQCYRCILYTEIDHQSKYPSFQQKCQHRIDDQSTATHRLYNAISRFHLGLALQQDVEYFCITKYCDCVGRRIYGCAPLMHPHGTPQGVPLNLFLIAMFKAVSFFSSINRTSAPLDNIN